MSLLFNHSFDHDKRIYPEIVLLLQFSSYPHNFLHCINRYTRLTIYNIFSNGKRIICCLFLDTTFFNMHLIIAIVNNRGTNAIIITEMLFSK